MTKLCMDIDCIIFDAVSVMEEKYITATHKPTGQVMEFENKTALWGHHLKKTGGWVGQQNELSGGEYYKAEDFEVVDGQRLRMFKQKMDDGDGNEYTVLNSPAEGAKKIIDGKIKEICDKLGVHEYFGFTGTGTVFRHDLATLQPYKGQREDLLSPLLLKEMKQYVCDKHNCTLVTGIEADDAVSMVTVKAYKAWKLSGDEADKVIAVAVDKDSKQTEGWHFNPTKDEQPRLIEGFGKLWLDKKGDPDGSGRMWLYWQIAHGDETDNYKTSCFSGKKYAGKGAYNDLVDCKNDKQAWSKLVEILKRLYPEKITVTTFRGELEIDWLYVLQEMTNMAFMLRHEGDKIDVKTVLDKLGISYD